jgi:HSP20 family protein
VSATTACFQAVWYEVVEFERKERRNMMSISMWNPSTEMMPLRDAMDRQFEDSFLWPQSWIVPWNSAEMFPLDIYEDGSNLVVKAILPGIKPEDVYIEAGENVLIISGDIKQEKERKKEDYYLHERRYGHIQRSIILPCTVKVDQAEPEFEYGILTLTLPKAETTKRKRILLKPKV